MEDEIVINGEVYVRKRADIAPAASARLSSPALAVHSIQDKLNRTKLGGQQIGNSGQGDLPDGAALSVQNVQTIKQSLRAGGGVSDGVEIGQEPGDILTYSAPAPAPPPVSQPSVSYSNNNFSRRNVRVKEWGSF